LLERWHALMLEHAEDLARILTAEQGKPLAETRAEIGYRAGFALLKGALLKGSRSFGKEHEIVGEDA